MRGARQERAVVRRALGILGATGSKLSVRSHRTIPLKKRQRVAWMKRSAGQEGAVRAAGIPDSIPFHPGSNAVFPVWLTTES
jgi:hypothetical protein